MFRCLQARLPAHGSRLGVQRVFFCLSNGENFNIENLVKQDDIVIFMKGSPTLPRCGYSGKALALFNYYGVKFQTYDVLQSGDYKNAVKQFSRWPTFPQIFFKGEFFGGYDLLKSRHISGQLPSIFKHYGIEVEVKNKQFSWDNDN